MNKIISDIIDELIDQYREKDRYNRPWIIGFSGGKDSTALLTLTWMALNKLKLKKPGVELHRKVFVVCNDTLVENPIIIQYINDVLTKIEKSALEQNLPIIVRKTIPKVEDSFWSCVIGKGYPVPNNAFRYCTERLKIKPTSEFIENEVSENGEAIILIGTRSAESKQRARSIKKHEITGQRLSKHPLNPNTYTYAPIKNLYLEDVWYIIRSLESPWGAKNNTLFQIYSDASAEDYECPTVVTDETHKSCGQSRFGCWVCTVVKEDKSMSGLIASGETWMQPLLEFRNKLVENRNVSHNRSSTRRNGQPAVDETGHNMGNYTIQYRQELLKELLTIQKEIKKIKPHIELINNQELTSIQVIWYRDGEFKNSVNNIYHSVYGNRLEINSDFNERLLLKQSCNKSTADYNLIKELLELQERKNILMKNYGFYKDLESRIEDYINKNLC